MRWLGRPDLASRALKTTHWVVFARRSYRRARAVQIRTYTTLVKHPRNKKIASPVRGMRWLGRPDLNRRMEESKSSALPLGDGPVKIKNRAGALPTRFFGGVPREIRTLGLQSHNLAR